MAITTVKHWLMYHVVVVVVVFVFVFVVVVVVVIMVSFVVVIIVVAVHKYHLAAIQSQNEFPAVVPGQQ